MKERKAMERKSFDVEAVIVHEQDALPLLRVRGVGGRTLESSRAFVHEENALRLLRLVRGEGKEDYI